MNRIQNCLAATLVAVLSFASAAFADDKAQTPLPEPLSPVTAVVQEGRVAVYIGTSRPSAYQIGDSIPVTVVFELTPDAIYKVEHPQGVQTVLPRQPVTTPPKENAAAMVHPVMLEVPIVDLSGLKMSVLGSKPSDVEMLGNATVSMVTRADGKRLVVAKFFVTTYVTTKKTQVEVVADFMYAFAKLPDGQPDYRSASTPPLIIGITRAATTNQTRLIEGDLAEKTGPRAPAAFWFLVVSPLFALPLMISLGMIGYSLATRQRAMTKNQLTWLIFDKVFTDAQAAGGFSLEHYRRIFHALREHLGVLGLDTTQTLAALSRRPDLNREAVDYVFNRETVFFDPNATITSEGHDKLVASIAILVPRQ